jgi:hypothetical protein
VEETKWGNLEAALERNLETALEQIGSLDISEAWDKWLVFRDEGLGGYEPPPFVQHRQMSASWLRVIFGALIVAGFGLALMVVGLLLPSRPPRQVLARPTKRV